MDQLSTNSITFDMVLSNIWISHSMKSTIKNRNTTINPQQEVTRMLPRTFALEFSSSLVLRTTFSASSLIDLSSSSCFVILVRARSNLACVSWFGEEEFFYMWVNFNARSPKKKNEFMMSIRYEYWFESWKMFSCNHTKHTEFTE